MEESFRNEREAQVLKTLFEQQVTAKPEVKQKLCLKFSVLTANMFPFAL